MPLEEIIVNDLKKAIKARDELRTSCLRMLKTSIKNKQVDSIIMDKAKKYFFIVTEQDRKSPTVRGRRQTR